MMTDIKTFLAFLAALLIMSMSAYSAGPSADGESCINDMDCFSNRCHADYNISNGKFCSDSGFRCVHLEEGNILATIYDDGVMSDGYKCDKGTWKTSDADGDGVLDSDDLCPTTTAECTVSNGLIDPSDGCPYKPYRFRTSLEDYDNETCIVGSFGVLAEPLCGQNPSSLIKYVLDTVEKNTCDTTGDSLWPWPSDYTKYTCPIEDLSTPGSGTYALYAEYDDDGIIVTEKISSITINSDCNANIDCSLGVFVNESSASPTMSLTFSDSFSSSGGTYVTYEGTKVYLSGIANIQIECSDGDPTTQTPGVVGWVYYDGGYTGLSINNAYESLESRCISRTVERKDLIGPSSQKTGYFPDTSCANPLISGTTLDPLKTNSYILNQSGNYEIITDLVNAHCISPSSFICPWTDNPSRTTLCEVGTMLLPEYMTGWWPYATYSIKTISPSVEISTSSVEQEYEVGDPYDENEENAFVWEIENNGTGIIELSDIDVTCPASLSCSPSPISSVVIPEGSDADIVTEFTLPCEYSQNEYDITLSYRITDAYGIKPPSSVQTLFGKIILANHSDDSPAACQCYTGSTDNWDADNGCCDRGDCWITGDKSRICNDGDWIVGIYQCEANKLCNQEWHWSGNEWSEKIPPGCGCISSDQCSNCTCMNSICMELENPDIDFGEDTDYTVYLGDNLNRFVTVRNNLPVKDSVKLSITTVPDRLEYWSSFPNEENEILIDLNPNEERSVSLNIFCGEKGTYELTLVAESTLSRSLYSKATRNINVVSGDGGLTSSSPGLTITSVVIVLLIAVLYLQGNKKKTVKKKRRNNK